MASQSPRNVSAILNYYIDPGKDGDNTFFDGTIIESRRSYAPVCVTVTDVRGREDEFSLDKQGFQLLTHPSVEKDFDAPEKIRNVYYPECARILQSLTGATRVHVMSHIVRRQSWEKGIQDEKDLSDLEPIKQPSTARFVHVDVSYTGARALRDILLPDESQRLAKTRWAMINIWRPIQTVRREPLCLCDARSVSEHDLRERPLRMPPQAQNSPATMTGGPAEDISMWSVIPPTDPGQHKWFYASEMQPEEALFFKIFDSKQDGTARRAPHTAFNTPDDSGPPRNSLEVRCLVFWEDQPNQ